MATSWPISLDTIHGGATLFAERIAALTGDRFKITPRAAGEIAPPLEVLNVVSQGGVPCGHTAGYYYVGKSPAVAFGTSVPFGLNAQQQNAWLYEGGGLKKLQELYARKFGVIQFPCGNTGTQMGGWFRKEINSLSDLKGLKMRIPGLGGKVMGKLGVTVQTIPGSEIFSALQTGAIDAAEWVGPYNDLAFGLFRAAKYYYYPGWQEPGPTLECMINQSAYESLPDDLKVVVQQCCEAVNNHMLAEFSARNQQALKTLIDDHQVQLRRLPDTVLSTLNAAADEVLAEMAMRDPFTKRVYDSQRLFREQIRQWHGISEVAFYQARG
ncbi:MAG: ABC transporter substrate-binding protein [Alkalinema sp. RU_4_3]|nr:ABC transporter substrate-binding protein [Alkalinema sp. RU_4_3]